LLFRFKSEMSEDERPRKRARLIETAPLELPVLVETKLSSPPSLPIEAATSPPVAAEAASPTLSQYAESDRLSWIRPIEGRRQEQTLEVIFEGLPRHGDDGISARTPAVDRLTARLRGDGHLLRGAGTIEADVSTAERGERVHYTDIHLLSVEGRERTVGHLWSRLAELQATDAATYSTFCNFFLPDFVMSGRTTPPSARDALKALYDADRLGTGNDLTFSLQCLFNMFEVVGYRSPDVGRQPWPPQPGPYLARNFVTVGRPQHPESSVASGTIDFFAPDGQLLQAGALRSRTIGTLADVFGESGARLPPFASQETLARHLPPPPPPPPAREVPQEEAKIKEEACCVCLTYKINAVYPDCGHMVSCHECAKKIFASAKVEQRRCPTCRKETKAAPIKVFRGDA
jgi:hypothetical protein